jgi:energy-converting hydrogenase Eha subunit G
MQAKQHMMDELPCTSTASVTAVLVEIASIDEAEAEADILPDELASVIPDMVGMSESLVSRLLRDSDVLFGNWSDDSRRFNKPMALAKILALESPKVLLLLLSLLLAINSMVRSENRMADLRNRSIAWMCAGNLWTENQ